MLDLTEKYHQLLRYYAIDMMLSDKAFIHALVSRTNFGIGGGGAFTSRP